MPQPNVPNTRTRLKGIVTLRVQRGGADLADRDSQPPLDPNAYTIVGSATEVTIDEKRDGNNQRYELRGDYTAFEPAETYPGKVSYSITIARADMYDANLLEAFGYDNMNNNIVRQLKALTIFVEQPVPTDTDGVTPLTFGGVTFKGRTLIVHGCWLNGYTMKYDITEDDQKYVLNVTMIARSVIDASAA